MRRATVRALFCAIIAWVCMLGSARPARAAFDPTLRFYTIETPHFRITYHNGIEEVAQHVASTCESIYGNMVVATGHEPDVKTEVVLTDNSEAANGSASSLPYNAIHLVVTAPDDNSPLGDVDDWYLELVTHEFTHILHTDNIHGLPVLVNAILGKTLAPNQIQPRWILEGWGVFQESARTSAGRLNNTMWNMFMRTDVLSDNIATLDQMSSSVRRWPQGNLIYLYGSYFIQWIAETYGEDAIRKVSYDYGGQLIPWGIQRSIRRATGRTYDELYPAWIESTKRKYAAQAAAVKKRGLREGTRLTHHGQVARYPRWIPKTAWAEHQGGLLYFRDDQVKRVGLYAIDLQRDASGAVVRADEKNADLVARTPSDSFSSFLPDGSLVFGSSDFYRNVFLFDDLEKIEAGEKSPYGLPDGRRKRLTAPGLRASDPATSPDGRRIVFTQNHAGTRTIQIADLLADGIANPRPLVPTAFLEQAFTPRWSPDGTHVVYSVWKRGGYRDIRYVDVRDGTYRDLTDDRAVDGGPSFSPDGKWIYFHSDRTGIMNVHAYEIATGSFKQVSNVLTGAYAPDASPDGKTIAYIGYGKAGFDLYAMPVDESTWTDAEPYIDEHSTPPHVTPRAWPSRPYSPWSTLIPRRYSVQITPGNFGQAVIITAAGNDITALHGVAASMTVEVEKPELQGSIGYTYSGLAVDYGVSAFRTISPRAGYGIGAYKPIVIQETTGISSTLTYSQLRAFDSRIYTVSHSIGRVGAELPIPIDKYDPYETPSFPTRGLTSTLHFGFSFNNAERYLWSVGSERGYNFSLAVDVTDPLLGSEFAGFATNGDFTTYFLMPWLKQHSLALHAGGGTSGGQFPGRGAFFVGGFVDLPLVDTIRNQLVQGGIVLRGYAPVTLAGRSYVLTNAEYRFPIVNVDRGPSTLPIFLNRINGALFVDYGSAFDSFTDADFKTGVGGELWFDATLAYVAPFTFRLGHARGLSSLGIDKTYVVTAFPF